MRYIFVVVVVVAIFIYLYLGSRLYWRHNPPSFDRQWMSYGSNNELLCYAHVLLPHVQWLRISLLLLLLLLLLSGINIRWTKHFIDLHGFIFHHSSKAAAKRIQNQQYRHTMMPSTVAKTIIIDVIRSCSCSCSFFSFRFDAFARTILRIEMCVCWCECVFVSVCVFVTLQLKCIECLGSMAKKYWIFHWHWLDSTEI